MLPTKCSLTYKQMRIIVKLVYQVAVASSSLYYIILKEDNSPHTQFYLWLNCLLWTFPPKNSTMIKCQPSPIPNWGNPNNHGFNWQMLSILEFNSLNSKSQNKFFVKTKTSSFSTFWGWKKLVFDWHFPSWRLFQQYILLQKFNKFLEKFSLLN